MNTLNTTTKNTTLNLTPNATLNLTPLNRRRFLAALALGVATTFAAPFASPVLAHEANCPFCALPVVQDTDKTDNEVALKYGRKRIEYRCVYCALSEAQTDYKEGDLTIYAPSEKKGEPAALKRTNGQWSAPDGTIFSAQKDGHINHKVCQVTYRAFTSQAALEAWAKAHPEQFDKDAKPLTLVQMLDLTKPATK